MTQTETLVVAAGATEIVGGRRLRSLSPRDRLLLHVSIDRDTGCWNWTSACDRSGYAKLSVGGRHVRAHRFAYEEFAGPIPEGLTIDHLCRNVSCVNPQHLEPVTDRENVLRGFAPAAINARKTHCDRGHRLSPDNLYPSAAGRRVCRECGRAKAREHQRRKRAARRNT